MPCEWLRHEDGTLIHLKVPKRRASKEICKFCHTGRITKLCDAPIGEGRTCDAGMCDNCARTLGYQDLEIAPKLTKLNETFDVCPIHRSTTAYSRENKMTGKVDLIAQRISKELNGN